jgi:cyclic pyranopterin phosphate synthase
VLDISRKTETLRIATARATVQMAAGTVAHIRNGTVPKGDPLAVARLAAIQAAKNTPQLIPYCHPVPLDFVGVEFELGEDRVAITVTAKAVAKTGVEMEALTGAAAAALTVYDMLKMLDDSLLIGEVALVSKKGGKSDFRDAFGRPLRAAVVVVSDSIAAGKKEDRSGRIMAERLEAEGVEVADHRVIPDDAALIQETVQRYCDEAKLDLVLTTGGTGLGPRDTTPEALTGIIEREAPGIAEAMRAYGQRRTPRAMLSRGRAGVRGKTLIVALPGSRGGVTESLDALLPGLFHALHMMWGEGHL